MKDYIGKMMSQLRLPELKVTQVKSFHDGQKACHERKSKVLFYTKRLARVNGGSQEHKLGVILPMLQQSGDFLDCRFRECGSADI